MEEQCWTLFDGYSVREAREGSENLRGKQQKAKDRPEQTHGIWLWKSLQIQFYLVYKPENSFKSYLMSLEKKRIEKGEILIET